MICNVKCSGGCGIAATTMCRNFKSEKSETIENQSLSKLTMYNAIGDYSAIHRARNCKTFFPSDAKPKKGLVNRRREGSKEAVPAATE